MRVGGGEEFVGIEQETFVEAHRSILHIVDVGTYAIHAVGGFDSHYIVNLRFGEAAIHEVDGLVAAVAEEDVLSRYALHLRQFVLEGKLEWVGVAVVGIVIGVLVGIEIHTCVPAAELVAGAAVGG